MKFFTLLLLAIISSGFAYASPREIIVIGDSLAKGHGATSEVNTPSGCLASFFGREVTTLAEVGYTSDQILEDAKVVAKKHPEWVFVSATGNDVAKNIWSPGSYPKERSLQEMTELFDVLTASGSQIIYLGINPPFLQTDDRLKAVWALAQEKGALVVDGMSDLWERKEWMSDDLHPNDEGYRRMCKKIVEVLQSGR